MNPQPGEIWLADLGLAAKTRPVVIVSRRDRDHPLEMPLVSDAFDNAGTDPVSDRYARDRCAYDLGSE